MDKLDAIARAKEGLQVLEELLVEEFTITPYEVIEMMSAELSEALESAMYAHAQNMDYKTTQNSSGCLNL